MSGGAQFDLSALRLFVTADHDCGYLPQRQARNLVADPQSVDQSLYDRLIRHGFRRSGEHVYRPYCEACTMCRSLRVPTAAAEFAFRPGRSQRRCRRRNADLHARWMAGGFYTEHYDLYQRYVAARHAGGGMDESSPDAYNGFLFSAWCATELCELRDGRGRLHAVAVVDRLADGLSAVYTFFDPEQNERGLGTFAVLMLLDEAARRGLPWVYLGYWVEDCAKMDYKARFRPHQVFVDRRWRWEQPSSG